MAAGVVKVDCQPMAGEWRCSVVLDASGGHATHSVSVTRADVERWGRGEELGEVTDLVRRSFEFLLEREAAASILKSFELSVIQRYFPEYDRLFRRSV